MKIVIWDCRWGGVYELKQFLSCSRTTYGPKNSFSGSSSKVLKGVFDRFEKIFFSVILKILRESIFTSFWTQNAFSLVLFRITVLSSEKSIFISVKSSVEMRTGTSTDLRLILPPTMPYPHQLALCQALLGTWKITDGGWQISTHRLFARRSWFHHKLRVHDHI